MEIYDKYLFDDLVQRYNQNNLSKDEYESIFAMFQNINEYSEVKFYLYTMKFLGLGTKKQEEEVLSELKREIENGHSEYRGLYYDMLLYRNSVQRIELIQKISEFTEYDSRYMKKYSYVNNDLSDTHTNIDDCEWESISKQMQDNRCENAIVTLNRENRLLLHNAFRVDAGYISPYMTTNNELNYADYTDAKILFFKGELNIRLILPLLEQVVQEGINLIIITQHIDKELLKTFNVNISRGTFHVCAIETDFEQKNEQIETLVSILKSSVITHEIELEKITLQDLVTIQRAIIYYDVMYLFLDGKLAFNNMVSIMEVFVNDEDTLIKYENYLKPKKRLIQNNTDCFVSYIANRIDNNETLIVEKGSRIKTYFEEVPTLYLDAGLLSKDFINCVEQRCANWDFPSLLLMTENIDHIDSILPILELSIQEKKPLIFIGTNFSQEVVELLSTNVKKGLLKCGCIKVNTDESMEEIIKVLGLQSYSKTDIKNIQTIYELNYVEHVYCWEDKCCIVPRKDSENILKTRNDIEVKNLVRISAGGVNLNEQSKMYDDLVALINKMQ